MPAKEKWFWNAIDVEDEQVEGMMCLVFDAPKTMGNVGCSFQIFPTFRQQQRRSFLLCRQQSRRGVADETGKPSDNIIE